LENRSSREITLPVGKHLLNGGGWKYVPKTERGI